MGNSPLSICMFSNLYYPIVSGSSTQSRYLGRELVRRGHRVTFITARTQKDTPEHEVDDGVEVYRVPAILLPKIPLAFNFPWLSYTFTRGNLRLLETIIDKFDGLMELDTVRIIEGIYHTIQVKKFSVQQKNVQLTYHIDGTIIRITSTGKII